MKDLAGIYVVQVRIQILRVYCNTSNSNVSNIRRFFLRDHFHSRREIPQSFKRSNPKDPSSGSRALAAPFRSESALASQNRAILQPSGLLTYTGVYNLSCWLI